MPPSADYLRHGRIHRGIALAVACGVVCAVAAAMVVYWRRGQPETAGSAHEVPLGVEEAVIIRYTGPRLAARPYRRGASINVRIADEALRGDLAVYDVRYVVSLPGEFDLKDYLTATDGGTLDDLPSFRVRGLTSLTKDIETRIREIENVGVHVWHWYYETLCGLGALWALWLAGLIWIGRPKRVPPPSPPPPEPTLPEQIAAYFAALREGQLTTREKARLEILLIRHWRERLALGDDRLAAACRRMQRHAAVGRAYEAVQTWLHAPATDVEAEEVVEICTPLLEKDER